MKTIKHIFQLRLTSKEVVRSKQILALIMVPLFIFQMSSLNLAFINVANAEDETPDTAINAASDESKSEDNESNSEEVNNEDDGEEEEQAASGESDSEEEDSDDAAQQSDEEDENLGGENDGDEENENIGDETGGEEGLAGNETKDIEETTEENPVITPEAAATTAEVEASIEASTEATEEETETEDETVAEEPEWQIDGDKWTIGPVEPGKTYKAPQNEKVTIAFTELPDEPGNLSIEEITLSDEQVAELGALSNKAYDITSDMENGTFEYDLTLPKPEGVENVQIKYAEDESDLDNAEILDDVNVENGKVEAEGIDHFTIFVATNDDNRTKEWAHVDQISKGTGTTDLKFISTRNFYSCFEYRTDGDTSQIISENGGANYNTEITDGLYPYTCVKNSVKTRTITANEYVEVRMVFGAESDERFDWTRFDVDVPIYTPTRICHATGNGQYVSEAPANAGILNGHTHHSDDIIPPIPTLLTEGQNWDYRGEAIWSNNCVIPTTLPSVPTGGQPDDEIIKTNNFNFTWNASTGNSPITYEFQSSLNPAESDGVLTTGLWHSSILPSNMIHSSGAPDGKWYWQVRAIDVFGNTSAWSEIWDVTLDTQLPAKPSGLKFKSLDRTTDFACGSMISLQTVIPDWDDMTGDLTFSHYEYTSFHPNGNTGIHEQVLDVSELDNSWIPPTDGVYGYAVRSVDTAGNKSDWALSAETLEGSCQIIYDTAAPTKPVITKPFNEQYFKTTPIRNEWTTSSDSSGIKEYWVEYIYEDGHEFSGGPYRVATTNWRNHIPALSEQGGVTIRVQAWDNAGNGSEWSDPVHYHYDATPPSAPTLIAPINNSIVKGTPSLTNSWNPVDGAVKYIYESYHNESATNPRWHEEPTGTSKTANNVADATFWWRVKAVDAAGNEAWSEMRKLTIDNTKPVITLIGDATVTVAQGSGYSDDGATASDDIDGDVTANIITVNPVDANVVGTYTITYNVADSAGNTADQKTRTVNVTDQTPPEIPNLISPTNGAVVRGDSLTNSWSSISDAVKYIYESYHDENAASRRWYQEINAPGTSKTATGVADATFWWRVKAVDAAGNESGWSDLWKVTVDNIKPTIPSGLSFSTTEGEILGCENITDEYEIIAKWSASYDANFSHYEYRSYNPTDGWIWNGGNIGNTLSRTGAFTVGQGLYGFAVRAVDKAGNVSDWTSENLSGSCQITYDSTAPEFSLSGIKYSNGTVKDKYVTNWNTPVFVGNLISGDITSVKVVIDGTEYLATINGTDWEAIISSALSDGNHSIKVVATDLAGNSTEIAEDLFIDTKAPTATHAYYKDGNLITDPIVYVNNIGQLTFTGKYEDENPSSGLYWDSYVIFEAQDDHSFRFSANGKKSFCGWRSKPNLADISSGSITTPVSFANCISSLPNGEYYLAHQISDSATRKDIPSINQFKDVLGLHFIVDSTAPIITVNNPDADPAKSKTVTASTNEGTLSMHINDFGITTCDGSLLFSAYADTTFSTEADNGKTICYQAVDSASNTTYELSNAIAGIDTTAPTVEIINPTGSLLTGTVEVRGMVTDEHPHHYWLQIKKNGSVISDNTINESNSFTDRLLATLTDDGDYEVTLAARDAVGGTFSSGNRSANITKTFAIDNTAPEAPVLTGKPIQYVQWGNVTRTWSASSSNDVDYYIYKNITNGWERKVSAVAGQTDYSITDSTGNYDRVFEYQVAAVDYAGNMTWSAETYKIVVDNTPPALDSQTDFGTDWHNASQTSVFTYSDANGITSGTPVTCVIGTEGANQTCIVTPNVCDAAGNCNTDTVVSSGANIDLTKPFSIITSPANEGDNDIVYSNSWDGSISGTASDDRSGVAGVKISIQEKSLGYWTGSVWQTDEFLLDASGTDSWSYNELTSPEDGEYTIKSHAIDNAGNVENTYSLTIISDKTIPEVSLTIDPANPDGDNNWYISISTITLKATDANFEKIEYQIDSNSGTWIDYSSPVKIDEGKHIFYYRAWDLAGNVSGEGVKNVKVDTEDPDKVSDLDAEYDEDDNSVKLTWDADDDDIHKVYIYRGGSRGFHMNSGSLIGKNDDNDETFTDDDVERGEKYYYKLVSRDEAGNKSGAKVISVEITEEGNAVVTDEGVDNSSQGSNLEEGQEGSEEGQQSEEIQGASNEEGTTLGEETQKGGGNAKRTFWIIFFIALLGLIFYLLYRRRRNRIANETQL